MIKRIFSIILSVILIIVFCGIPYLGVTNSENKFQSKSEVYNNKYTKFQNKMSIDWDFIDHEFLLKIATYKGGSPKQRAYTILVTLNRMLDKNYPNTIKEVVLDELYNVDGLTNYDFENIVIDDISKQGMDLVVCNKIDNSYGLTKYINFK